MCLVRLLFIIKKDPEFEDFHFVFLPTYYNVVV